MKPRKVNRSLSGDIIGWLKSFRLLFDLEDHGLRWTVTAYVADIDEADEYLCSLETAWQERFGAEPVEFKAYQPRPFRFKLPEGAKLVFEIDGVPLSEEEKARGVVGYIKLPDDTPPDYSALAAYGTAR